MPRAATEIDPERSLMIKCKACQRLVKESLHYFKEAQDNEKKLQVMKRDPEKNQYDVKLFQQVMDESHRMLPDVQRRLQAALLDLDDALQNMQDDSKCEWVPIAQELVREHYRPKVGFDVIETNLDDVKENDVF